MSVDDRLRQGLERNALSFVPEGERRLADVRQQHRSRQLVRWSVVGTAAAATVVVAVGLLGGGDQDTRPTPPAESPTATPPTASVLTGDYARRLRNAGDRTGRWMLGFDADGILDVTPPSGYRGVVSGSLFTATADLRTNLFEQDLCSGRGPGTYTWDRSGTALDLVVVDDTCAARVELLAGGSWEQVDARGQP